MRAPATGRVSHMTRKRSFTRLPALNVSGVTTSVSSFTSPGGGATASPMPKTTAYDLLLEISAHVPGKDKVTIDIERLSIDEQKIDISGTGKSSEEIDQLITELKKVECFKNLTRGPTDTLASGAKRFKLTIAAQCMGAS